MEKELCVWGRRDGERRKLKKERGHRKIREKKTCGEEARGKAKLKERRKVCEKK